MTETIFSTDAYAQNMSATVVRTDVDDKRILLDRTVFYPGGGGQPHDTGTLSIGDDRLIVSKVTGDRDGVPNVLLEAIDCGAVIVASDLPALREVVEDDVTGFLAPPDQPAALAAAILRAFRSNSDWPRIRRQARSVR